MYKLFKLPLILLCLFVLPGYAWAGSEVEEIKLNIGEKTVYADGRMVELYAAPEVYDGVTMVPLNFMSLTGMAEVSWDNERKEALLRHGEDSVTFRMGSAIALVNGAQVDCGTAPLIEDGNMLVPLRFFGENLNYRINYQKQTKTVYLNKYTPNQAPVADFIIKQDKVAQGETVLYEDNSRDPDGDELVEYRWSGRERAFFSPGEHEVTLRVKDSKGAWSEPCTKVIEVTGEVKMDPLTYLLHHPIPGEVVNISHIDVLGLKRIEPRAQQAGGKVLVSNSPETVRREGVLYSDVVSGEVRVYYHHANGLPRAFGIFLVAQNNGEEPVEVKVHRNGAAGPGTPVSVGRASALSYLNSAVQGVVSCRLGPGEKVVLNKGDTNKIKPGQATHGIYDLEVDGEVTVSVVSATGLDRIDYVSDTFLIPGDGMHVRGTYPKNERRLEVRYSGGEPARVIVADGQEDRFLHGKDAGKWLQNKGNYGINYKVTIKSDCRVGVLFNARGGTFAGAGNFDGESFYIPNTGILQPQKEAALLGIVEAREEKVFEFIPPAGSSLPVNLLLLPVN